MSRVARMPVPVPKGVEVNLAAESISVKGPLGTLNQRVNTKVRISREGDELKFAAADESREAAALSGTYRALVSNMVTGVTKGRSDIISVGLNYRWDDPKVAQPVFAKH